MSCGIYRITNKLTQKHYIGSSKYVEGRWAHHRKHLVGNNHHSPKLQNAWNKYGPDVWEWVLLQECEELTLEWHEAFWMAKLNCEYNSRKITLEGSTFLHTFPEEMRKNMSRVKLGHPVSDETKKKMSEAKKGKTPHNKGRKGFKHSEDTKLKMSKARKGKVISEKHKQSISLAQKGRKHTPEHRQKIRESRSK
jgi:group I intron endonuclease